MDEFWWNKNMREIIVWHSYVVGLLWSSSQCLALYSRKVLEFCKAVKISDKNRLFWVFVTTSASRCLRSKSARKCAKRCYSHVYPVPHVLNNSLIFFYQKDFSFFLVFIPTCCLSSIHISEIYLCKCNIQGLIFFSLSLLSRWHFTYLL